MTEIIKIHYKISKPVASYSEIKEEADKMLRFIVRGRFLGFYNKAFAIAHCQVSETPYAFFVVSPEVVNEKLFEKQVIINPQIVSSPLYLEMPLAKTNAPKDVLDKLGNKVVKVPNALEYNEPCMSFPFRQPKRIVRYNKIKVKYQIKTMFGLKTIERELGGIASEIFQHEYDHTIGKNIYFETGTPIKWWELIGRPKSKGGTSLDDPDELGLLKSKEVESVDIKID